MRILLDESLPKRLVKEFKGHIVFTVVGMGWSGKKNGELLKLAQEKFNVFITADQNLQYQQKLHGYQIAIIVLVASSNRFDDLKPLAPKALKSLTKIKHGEILRIS